MRQPRRRRLQPFHGVAVRSSRRTRLSLALVFALVFVAAPSRQARAVCQEFAVPPAVSTATGGFLSTVVADIDRDGDLDPVAASFYDGRIAWFENDGAAGWTLTTIAASVTAVYGVATGDLDGDGDADVLSAAIGGGLAWYRNDDPGTATWSAQPIAGLSGAVAVVAADLDLDGDLDVLASSRSSTPGALTVAWFANDGAGGGWTPTEISSSTVSARALVAADLDGDGDLDVLSGSYDNDTLSWWENDGDGGGWAHHSVSIAVNGLKGAAVADVDGDGDLDAISSSRLGNQISWHENVGGPGDGTSWTTHTIATNFYGARFVTAHDVDGDGDPDVVATGEIGGVLAWFENRGATWLRHTLAAEPSFGAWSAAVADFDRDGDLDASAVFSLSTNGKLAWYRNDVVHGDGLFLDRATVSTAVGGMLSIAAADLDRDGDLDALTLTKDAGELVWLENVAGDASSWSPHTLATSLVGYGVRVVARDIDMDGDLDAVVSKANAISSGPVVGWFENNGTATGWPKHTIYFGGNVWDAQVADLDRDGDPDVLSYESNLSTLFWYGNDGTGGGWAQEAVATVASCCGARVAVGDLDRDGDVDALLAMQAEGYLWYENLGGSWTTHGIATTGAANNAYSIAAADVDHDGDLDVVTANSYPAALVWYANDGTGNGWAPTTVSPTGDVATGALYAADLDGDGDLDLLASDYSGATFWHEQLAPGDGSSWTTHVLTGAAGTTPRALATADLDGDGDADVLTGAIDAGGPVLWFENAGTKVFTGGFDSETSAPASLACWSSTVP